jgi:hypothetical protein
MLQHHISLRNVYDYADSHKNELQCIENIFELGSEKDKQLCLALFRLIAKNEERRIANYFCNEYRFDDNLDDMFFEQNKILLITAFIYNPAFFAMAWNLCGIIKAEIAVDQNDLQVLKRNNAQQVFRFYNGAGKVHNLAASGKDVGNKKFGEMLRVSFDETKGELQLLGDDSGTLKLRFKFDKEYLQLPHLKVTFTVDATGESMETVLDKPLLNNNDMICSPIMKNIDISKGISITEVERIE